MDAENKITYFGETDFRNQKTRFGIKAKDRSKHMYVIGKTGMGKSTLLENLAIQDIQNDEGMIFIDPHGSTAAKLLEYIPRHRIDDVVYFAPHDTDFPIAFNVLETVAKEKRNAVAGGLMSAFKKIWVDSFSSRMEYLLNYTLLALLDVPGSTLLGINRLLSDKVYRKYVVDRVEDTLVKNFWNTEFEKYSTSYATEAVAPIQNKVGQFIASPMVRNIVGQEVSTIDFRTFMDQKKIVIINISKGIIGPENMRLLGGMLITKIQLAAMSRANLDEAALKRIPNTYLYVDEFQNFANESFAEILSESRKYKLCLTVANQYIDQMTEEVRNAVIGNVGTFISFRVGSTDAELMEKEFAPNFLAEDMVNLGFTQMYLKLMIDGIGSRPFSANSLPPIPKPEKSYVEDIIAFSRKQFAGEKEIVEVEIKKWTSKDFNLNATQNNSSTNNAGTNPLPRKTENRDKPYERQVNPTSGNNRGDRNDNRTEYRNDRNESGNDNRIDNRGDNRNDSRGDSRVDNRPPRPSSNIPKEVEVVQRNKNTNNKDPRENVAKKEIEKLIKVVEKEEKKEVEKIENLRKKVLLNMQKIHALQKPTPKPSPVQTQAQSPVFTKTRDISLDEVPEDILKALLDTSDL
jgi:energy-coupling factor transporter ATP-binding protein EcfA2